VGVLGLLWIADASPTNDFFLVGAYINGFDLSGRVVAVTEAGVIFYLELKGNVHEKSEPPERPIVGDVELPPQEVTMLLALAEDLGVRFDRRYGLFFGQKAILTPEQLKGLQKIVRPFPSLEDQYVGRRLETGETCLGVRVDGLRKAVCEFGGVGVAPAAFQDVIGRIDPLVEEKFGGFQHPPKELFQKPPPPPNQTPVSDPGGPYRVQGDFNHQQVYGAIVTLDGGKSSDPDGMITSYLWDFGDGDQKSSPQPAVAHFYTGNPQNDTTYRACLTVTDDRGATNTQCTSVTILKQQTIPNQSPIADPNGPYEAQGAFNQQQVYGATVVLDGRKSRDPDGRIVSYSWDFGDQETDIGPLVKHFYRGDWQRDTVYSACLTVVDEQGATDRKCTRVTILRLQARAATENSDLFGARSLSHIAETSREATSDYALGTVAVSILFLESQHSGGGPSCVEENWEQSRITAAVEQVKQALSWWETQAPTGWLSFRLDRDETGNDYRIISIPYEPICHKYSEEFLWINAAMEVLGYSGGYDGVRSYIDALRRRLATDWGYVVFIVDSYHDFDGRFAPSSFGRAVFAYTPALGGPFLVLTYDNDGWGIDAMRNVAAHEIGHIFFATDEYTLPGEWSGYLNTREIDDSGCLMYSNNLECISEGSRAQIGWLDTDGDEIPDPVDIEPETELSLLPAGTGNLILSGRAYVRLVPNRNPIGYTTDGGILPPQPSTVKSIQRVEYRINGGEWAEATASDGAFDDKEEDFALNVEVASESYTVEVRAVDSGGNIDSTPAVYVIEEGHPPALVVDQVLLYPNPLTNSGARIEVIGSGIARIELEVFTLAGHRVLNQDAFSNRLLFQGLDDTGRTLANGVYLYVVTARGFNGEMVRSQLRKLVILR